MQLVNLVKHGFNIFSKSFVRSRRITTSELLSSRFVITIQARKMSYITIKEVSVEPLILGESPHWDHINKVLYYVCIMGGTIHKYNPLTKEHTKTQIGPNVRASKYGHTKADRTVAFIVPVEGKTDEFLVGVDCKLMIIRWDGKDGSTVKTVKEIATVDEGRNNRFNDGKVDPRGRLFAGTMYNAEPTAGYKMHSGALYRLEKDSVNKMADKISISNGLCWDLGRNAFYYIDSMERSIRRYDYDIATGTIHNMEHFFDFCRHDLDGFPDGMTVDLEGNLWVACYDGSCIIQIDPMGRLVQKIGMPVFRVTSLVFGGQNMNDLYVTTASSSYKELMQPGGRIYVVSGLGVTGTTSCCFRSK